MVFDEIALEGQYSYCCHVLIVRLLGDIFTLIRRGPLLLVGVKNIVRRLQNDCGINFQQSLPQRIRLLNEADIHRTHSLFCSRESGRETWIGFKLATGPIGLICGSRSSGCFARKLKGEWRAVVAGALAAVLQQSLTKPVRAADIQMLFAFGEQVHPSRRHLTWQWYGHRGHCNEVLNRRVQRLYVCAKPVVHTIMRANRDLCFSFSRGDQPAL